MLSSGMVVELSILNYRTRVAAGKSLFAVQSGSLSLSLCVCARPAVDVEAEPGTISLLEMATPSIGWVESPPTVIKSEIALLFRVPHTPEGFLVGRHRCLY